MSARALAFTIFGSMAWLLQLASQNLLDYKFVHVSENLATLGEFPWHVSVQFFGQHACGATIISEKWILTAAHCIEVPLPRFLLKIRANSNSLVDGNSTWHSVAKVMRHPGFKQSNITSEDIALVQVDPPFVFGQTAQPAQLPEQDEDIAPGKQATTIGWGFVEKGLMSSDLIKVEQEVRSREECFEIFQPQIMLTEAQMCADSFEEATEICTGNSGGPLLMNGKVMGIVSWSANDCDDHDFPSVYTRVSSFRDWIRDSTGV